MNLNDFITSLLEYDLNCPVVMRSGYMHLYLKSSDVRMEDDKIVIG